MELISNISVVIASCVAIYGINAWRREFRGKRRIELAEDVLALFYEAQDVIRAIRSPLAFGGEGSTRKPQDNETPKVKKARDDAYVVVERYQKRQELFSKIHSMRYRFMAQIDCEAAKPFEDLRGIVNELFGAARRLARLWTTDISSLKSEEQQKQHFEKQQKYELIFWESYDEHDPINPRLDKVVSDMESICRGIITANGSGFSIFNKLWSRIRKLKKNNI